MTDYMIFWAIVSAVCLILAAVVIGVTLRILSTFSLISQTLIGIKKLLDK
jgi:hypothetical protein